MFMYVIIQQWYSMMILWKFFVLADEVFEKPLNISQNIHHEKKATEKNARNKVRIWVQLL